MDNPISHQSLPVKGDARLRARLAISTVLTTLILLSLLGVSAVSRTGQLGINEGLAACRRFVPQRIHSDSSNMQAWSKPWIARVEEVADTSTAFYCLEGKVGLQLYYIDAQQIDLTDTAVRPLGPSPIYAVFLSTGPACGSSRSGVGVDLCRNTAIIFGEDLGLTSVTFVGTEALLYPAYAS